MSKSPDVYNVVYDCYEIEFIDDYAPPYITHSTQEIKSEGFTAKEAIGAATILLNTMDSKHTHYYSFVGAEKLTKIKGETL
jgi:hypothetical protein